MVKNILLKWENSSEKRKKYHGDPRGFTFDVYLLCRPREAVSKVTDTASFGMMVL